MVLVGVLNGDAADGPACRTDERINVPCRRLVSGRINNVGGMAADTDISFSSCFRIVRDRYGIRGTENGPPHRPSERRNGIRDADVTRNLTDKQRKDRQLITENVRDDNGGRQAESFFYHAASARCISVGRVAFTDGAIRGITSSILAINRNV